ncbi:2-polyprenyl-6-hydroxyphenyl methylase / 3-demethylubiquinone-9 3-methyltransferase [Methylobacterium sp. 174MFSha1.1]|uniref:class I SAM-dependent methyltransferase n=1 Tax=Methylobacterium sp. 174MFSha1.1 TaxID=1502749 RepID=UPI0008E4A729|nr:class I SAM-dependent methyltransferase [Methylobacterium sp. 174MFSha1.1]SFU83143.1 2-polyprenyl-6-hydroxyphenyl methylase / 3-demethylubiquinone-9 3-methyltransferase [Methylobacterium sp. 174MFSha1.1]
MADASGYHYGDDGDLGHHYSYLLAPVMQIIDDRRPDKIFELGCGNGSLAAHLTEKGYCVTGVDPSADGIGVARTRFPSLKLEVGSAYDNLAERYGRFPLVLSLEVVEHVYDPRSYARTVFSLLDPGGTLVLSTPYHGYAKNLLLALSGKMDAHFTALWDHGHIKFWSMKTLTALLHEAGFVDITFRRVGRLPPLAKSMIAVARRPDTAG